MSTEIISKTSSEVYVTAVRLHGEIMASAETAATSLFKMCDCLKRMRDEELYSQFDFESFDDYCEKMVGIKSRQAYNYIATYEKLGATVLQSNAKLGITKLELISQLPAIERVEKLESGELGKMSAREIKELVKASKEQAEQIDLFKKAAEDAQDEKSIMEDRVKELLEDSVAIKTELEELRTRPVEVAVEEMSQKEKDKIKADIRKEVEKELKGKQKEIIEKEVGKRTEFVEREAAKKAKVEAVKEQQDKIDRLMEKLSESETVRENLEKKLKTSDGTSTTAKIHFETMKDSYRKMISIIEKMDESSAVKFRDAVKTALTMLLSELS